MSLELLMSKKRSPSPSRRALSLTALTYGPGLSGGDRFQELDMFAVDLWGRVEGQSCDVPARARHAIN